MREPALFVESMKKRTACGLGQKICESFPFAKDVNRSWPDGRSLPGGQIFPGYGTWPEDIYTCQVVVLSKDNWHDMTQTIRKIMLDVAVGLIRTDQGVDKVLQAIDHHCKP
jgi:hypothetical protein